MAVLDPSKCRETGVHGKCYRQLFVEIAGLEVKWTSKGKACLCFGSPVLRHTHTHGFLR